MQLYKFNLELSNQLILVFANNKQEAKTIISRNCILTKRLEPELTAVSEPLMLTFKPGEFRWELQEVDLRSTGEGSLLDDYSSQKLYDDLHSGPEVERLRQKVDELEAIISSLQDELNEQY